MKQVKDKAYFSDWGLKLHNNKVEEDLTAQIGLKDCRMQGLKPVALPGGKNA